MVGAGQNNLEDSQLHMVAVTVLTLGCGKNYDAGKEIMVCVYSHQTFCTDAASMCADDDKGNNCVQCRTRTYQSWCFNLYHIQYP